MDYLDIDLPMERRFSVEKKERPMQDETESKEEKAESGGLTQEELVSRIGESIKEEKVIPCHWAVNQIEKLLAEGKLESDLTERFIAVLEKVKPAIDEYSTFLEYKIEALRILRNSYMDVAIRESIDDYLKEMSDNFESDIRRDNDLADSLFHKLGRESDIQERQEAVHRKKEAMEGAQSELLAQLEAITPGLGMFYQTLEQKTIPLPAEAAELNFSEAPASRLAKSLIRQHNLEVRFAKARLYRRYSLLDNEEFIEKQKAYENSKEEYLRAGGSHKDFDLELADVDYAEDILTPVCDKGEVFDPDEELLLLKKKRSPEALAEYKEKLAYQREGLAALHETLLHVFRIQPDWSTDQLEDIIQGYTSEYAFSDKQLTEIRKTFERINQQKSLIREFLAEHTEPDKIYEKLFGKVPVGKVELTLSPLMVYLRVFNPEDYTFAYVYGDSTSQNMSSREIAEETRQAELSGGYATTLSKYGLKIVLEKVREERGREWAEEVFDHEEQHVFYSFFSYFYSKLYKENLLQEHISPEKRAQLFSKLVLDFRVRAEMHAADEILAYSKGKRDPAEIQDILTRSKKKNGIYNFLADDKKRIYATLKEWKEKETLPSGEIDELKKTAIKMLNKDYKHLIKDGINIADRLIKIYGKEGTIALLTSEPLRTWSKLEKRLDLKE